MMKQVKGYDGYFVSDDGIVYSNLGQGNRNRENRTMMYALKPKISKTRPYPRVTLRNPETGKRDEKYIRRFVAEAFLPNPENKPIVINRDGSYSNNKVDNLMWCTLKEARNFSSD